MGKSKLVILANLVTNYDGICMTLFIKMLKSDAGENPLLFMSHLSIHVFSSASLSAHRSDCPSSASQASQFSQG